MLVPAPSSPITTGTSSFQPRSTRESKQVTWMDKPRSYPWISQQVARSPEQHARGENWLLVQPYHGAERLVLGRSEGEQRARKDFGSWPSHVSYLMVSVTLVGRSGGRNSLFQMFCDSGHFVFTFLLVVIDRWSCVLKPKNPLQGVQLEG